MSLSSKSAQQLQDVSRVLLGLAIALQHTASHEAKQLTQHAHIFHHSNKNAVNSAQHYADAAVNAAKQMATTFTPSRSSSSRPTTSPYQPPPPSSTSSASSTSAFSGATPSPLSSVLPLGADIVAGVSRVIGTVQSVTNGVRPTTAPSNPSPYPSSSTSSAFPSSVLPSGYDIALGVAKVIGAVQAVSGSVGASAAASSFTSPYSSSPSGPRSPSSSTAGSLSSVLPSGADIASNVSRVLGAMQSPLSAVSSLSSVGATAASNALPFLSSLPLPQLAAALVSSALPPGVPRPSAEQVNAAVNVVLSIAQQMAQQLSQQAASAATAQRSGKADNTSPYATAAGSSATDSSATIQPPSFVDMSQPSAPSSAASAFTAAPTPQSPTLSTSWSSSRSSRPSSPAQPNKGAASADHSAASLNKSDSDTSVPPSSSSSPGVSSTDLLSTIGAALSPSPTQSSSSTSTKSAPSFDLPAFLSQNKPADSTTPSTSSSTQHSSSSSTASESTPAPFDLPPPAFLSQPISADSTVPSPATSRPFEPRSRSVPSTPIGRVLGFGGIAMRMLTGTVVDATKRIWGGDDTANIASTLTPTASHSLSTDAPNSSSSAAPPSAVSRFLSPANTERLAEGLCRMRGAALKIGQMLSIQDDALLPPPLAAVLARVRDSADMMPQHQLRSVLSTEWGDEWEKKLERFDEQPIAAASIGQVHRGAVRGVGEVVVKVQYPGVADSIESDVENVRRLINWFNIAPKGLYLDKTMDAAKEELSAECDYRSEAANQIKFRQLLRSSPLHPRVSVPAVVESLCTRQVLVSEWVDGVPIDRLVALPQSVRNQLCHDMVQLCLLELFVWRFMQTDPNWSNFLYDTHSSTLHLIDFGACIAYGKVFIDDYLRMVYACAERDRSGVIEYSRRLGFITGEESREMLNAHVAAALIIGEPFSEQYAATGYDFAAMNMSGRVSELARVMVRLRLTAPPKESYTLHRKLSGCFLTCKKLQATVSLRDMFLDVYRQYQFD